MFDKELSQMLILILFGVIVGCSAFKNYLNLRNVHQIVLNNPRQSVKLLGNLNSIETVMYDDLNKIKKNVDSVDRSMSVFTATLIGAFVSYMYYYELRALFMGAVITNILARSKSDAGSLLRIWGYSTTTFISDLKNNIVSIIISMKSIITNLTKKYDGCDENEEDDAHIIGIHQTKSNNKQKYLVSKRFDELINSEDSVGDKLYEEEKFNKRKKVEYQLRVPVPLSNKVSTLIPTEGNVIQKKTVTDNTDEWSNSDLTKFKEWGKGIEWNQVKEKGSDLYKQLQEKK